MAKSLPRIKLAPGILSWARASAGWTLEETATKLQVQKQQLEGWETGETAVPLTRLEDLATLYRRPVAALFLPHPPAPPALPADFRSIPGGSSMFSKATWLALRRARRLREVARELMRDIDDLPRTEVGTAAVQDDPEEVASRERLRLGVTLEDQRAWQDEREALRRWRTAMESLPVLTFQFPMPVSDARGFSLADGGPPAIVVSSEDATHARIFTLLHEYGHIMLRAPGVCRPQEEVAGTYPIQLERWCDGFAGAVLLPQEALFEDETYQAFLEDAAGSKRHLARLSRLYKVSRYALLTRALTLGSISRRRYQQDRAGIQITPRRPGGRAPLPAARCIAEKGRAFTDLVVRALDRDLVNFSDVPDYLGIRIKHLDEVRGLLAG